MTRLGSTNIVVRAQTDTHWNAISKVVTLESFTNVRIHCKNHITLGANKIVLAGCSKFLSSIFSTESRVESYISLSYDLVCSHFEPEAMKKVLDLIYTGSTLINLQNKNIIDNMKFIVESLKIENLLQVFSNMPSAKEKGETILLDDSAFLTLSDDIKFSEENLEVKLQEFKQDLKLEKKNNKRKALNLDEMDEHFFQTTSNSTTKNPKNRFETKLDEETQACSICQITFDSESELEVHSITHNSISEKISRILEVVQNDKCMLPSKRKRITKHNKQGLEKQTQPMESYSCMVCNLQFQSPSEYASHLKTHSETQCNSNLGKSKGIFSSSYNDTIITVDLTDGEEEHLTEHHVLKKAVSTEKIQEHSGKSEENAENTKKDSEVNAGQSLQSCQICQRIFLTSACYEKHLKSHYLEPLANKEISNDTEEITDEPDILDIADGEIFNETFKAMLTNIQYDGVGSQPNHISPNPKQMFTCKFCQMEFHRMPLLEEHLKDHSVTKTPFFSCKLCKQVFCSNIERENHKKRHSIQKISKDINGKTNSSTAFKEDSPLSETTGMSNSIKSSAKILQQTKTEISPTQNSVIDKQKVGQCHLCQKSLSDNVARLRHLGVTHFRNEVKQYFGENNGECGLCKKVYRKSCSLIRHIVIEHKVLDNIPNIKEEASAAFKEDSSLSETVSSETTRMSNSIKSLV